MTNTESTTPTEDAQAAHGLGGAFRIPREVIETAPELASLYLEMVDRLRVESLGIPMHTAQELLIERIATKYILIKYREETGWAGMGVTAEKDANAQWLDIVKEWNRLLAAGHEQLRDDLLRKSEQIAVDAIKLVEDPELRQRLRLHFKERFAALGY